MFGVDPLARIVRNDARIEVKVPAAKGKKAYSYFREGGESEAKKPSGGGEKLALIGGGLALAGLGAAALAMSRKKPETINVVTPVNEARAVEKSTKTGTLVIGAAAAGMGGAAILLNKKKAATEVDLEANVIPSEQKRSDKRKAQEDAIIKGTGVSRKESQDMLRSVHYFTSNEGYKPIRAAEKEGVSYVVKSQDGQRDIDAVETLNKFLDLSPKYKGAVYRGMVLKEPALKPFLNSIQGDGLVLNAMSSFSEDIGVATKFARADFDQRDAPGVSVVLVSNSNKSGVDIRDISYTLMDEKEVLVPAGAFYKASKVEVRKGEEGRDVYYVYADEVDEQNQKSRRDRK